MCLNNPLPSPPSERCCDDVMTNTRRVFVNNREKNVIKTHFVGTYLCFMFYLFLVVFVFRLFQELKSSCGTFLGDPQNPEFVSTVGKRLQIKTKHH